MLKYLLTTYLVLHVLDLLDINRTYYTVVAMTNICFVFIWIKESFQSSRHFLAEIVSLMYTVELSGALSISKDIECLFKYNRWTEYLSDNFLYHNYWLYGMLAQLRNSFFRAYLNKFTLSIKYSTYFTAMQS